MFSMFTKILIAPPPRIMTHRMWKVIGNNKSLDDHSNLIDNINYKLELITNNLLLTYY